MCWVGGGDDSVCVCVLLWTRFGAPPQDFDASSFMSLGCDGDSMLVVANEAGLAAETQIFLLDHAITVKYVRACGCCSARRDTTVCACMPFVPLFARVLCRRVERVQVGC
jgi:hypothetical protein